VAPACSISVTVQVMSGLSMRMNGVVVDSVPSPVKVRSLKVVVSPFTHVMRTTKGPFDSPPVTTLVPVKPTHPVATSATAA
jgi:hypothetical protein